MAQQDRFYGWFVVVALFFIICINTAFPYTGAGVLNAAMAKDLQLDRKTVGLGFTAMMLISGFLGPVVAWVLGRLGARLTIFFGSLVLAGGALLMAMWVALAWQYVLVFGTMLALGVAMSTSIPVQTAVTFWFEKRRGLALSLVWTGAGIGGFFAAPLVNKIIAMSGGDWRPGWYFIAAAAVVTAMISLVFVRNSPADMGQVVDGTGTKTAVSKSPPKTHRTRENWPLREAFWTPANWIIMFGNIAFSLPPVIVFSHVVMHLKDLGHSPAVAAMGIGLVPFSAVFGKLLSGYLADIIEPRYIWGVAMMMVATGVLLLINASNPVDIYLFAALIGSGTGASVVCRSTLVGNYFGPKAFAGVLGMQTPILTVFSAGTPFLVGLAYDIQGSYTMAFYLVFALVFAAAVMVLFARPPQRKAASESVALDIPQPAVSVADVKEG